jgi:nucleotide-binding universal stress UspA family protein
MHEVPTMLPFRKILFPADYSGPSRAVASHVRDVREHFSAELAVVHAYGLGAFYGEVALADPSAVYEMQRLEEQRLQEFVARMFPGLHVETFLQQGEPASVIHDVVQHQGADLIMMPTQGRGPLRRLLLGSVTAKVLHDVGAAVWTGAQAAVEAHAVGTYKSILCAVDLGEEAEAVLQAAAALARSYKAQLSLVHVVEMPPPSPEVDVTLFKDELIHAANDRMREWKSKLGIDAPHTTIEGATADEVCREAARTQADLVVAGRGRIQGSLGRIWAHLYSIVRDSPCPVLSI